MKFSKILMIGMVLAVAILFVVGCQKQQTPTAPAVDTKNVAEKKVVAEDEETGNSLTGGAVADLPQGIDEEDSDVVEFKVTAKNMKFDPSVIKVRKGQTVRLYVTADDRDYGFSLAEFYIKKFVEEGETITVEFTPDKQGTFIFFSRIEWNNGRIGELGRLVVGLY